MTPDEYLRFVNTIPGFIQDNRSSIQEAGFNSVIAQHKNRIFLEGKSSNGSPIIAKAKQPREGVYSKSHGRKRRKRQKRTDKIYLFFEGDLFRSIQVGKSGDEVVLGFVDDKNADIASSHEQYRGQEIFKLSNSEISIMQEGAIAEIQYLVDKHWSGVSVKSA